MALEDWKDATAHLIKLRYLYIGTLIILIILMLFTFGIENNPEDPPVLEWFFIILMFISILTIYIAFWDNIKNDKDFDFKIFQVKEISHTSEDYIKSISHIIEARLNNSNIKYEKLDPYLNKSYRIDYGFKLLAYSITEGDLSIFIRTNKKNGDKIKILVGPKSNHNQEKINRIKFAIEEALMSSN